MMFQINYLLKKKSDTQPFSFLSKYQQQSPKPKNHKPVVTDFVSPYQTTYENVWWNRSNYYKESISVYFYITPRSATNW